MASLGDFFNRLKNLVSNKRLDELFNEVLRYLRRYHVPEIVYIVRRFMVFLRLIGKPKALLIASLVLGYVLLPLDLCPDFIPFFGLLDDVLLIITAMEMIAAGVYNFQTIFRRMIKRFQQQRIKQKPSREIYRKLIQLGC
ncbi:YkvA family protein [Pseudothermotoga thermarum]|uniref:DUF1232 domain-containing protein n=1 Tax=Pseudothermotoga thermarum DSM 5069 TaxID=688269 RepID=F7YTN8_9THEM|nr:YkvA family protein [Pseudothermotoga thermarum]AEH51260.1 protein of unknown function DUF1232 [Pseudothermotoga thermarum DSM 5069]